MHQRRSVWSFDHDTSWNVCVPPDLTVLKSTARTKSVCPLYTCATEGNEGLLCLKSELR